MGAVAKLRRLCLLLWTVFCLLMTLYSELDMQNGLQMMYQAHYNTTEGFDLLPRPAKEIMFLMAFCNGQFCFALLFFLATVRTEHFEIRMCQFWCINLLVHCPFVYLRMWWYWGSDKVPDTINDAVVGVLFGIFGFVLPRLTKTAKSK
mmetsp:Transcript_135275/g.420374  ORF Transcript_135275/g.420374 Transcript_135275/m.420374 type:complete len:148 (-) Transcript_135275:61-504(-)|eukprot:CAMPEP_0204587344 /NCGR_PEP_ID=MMETSP0661-20131031/47999_1 /ASSEMBLY_ACC=CAM_ASM_000606 /TAXON_ID=109239 /ORGANISM="Alexandrium margalefi, Strain AMGDE01CS-322" /LENGTH=147 /DNA_ID=CAMNT_0051597055 /DNA_START=78 /DNA_END=521 /DNA_ORIENTATION=-